MPDIFDQLGGGDIFDQVALDPRHAIAARKANPPATASGDPNASQEGIIAQALPMLRHPVEAAKSFASALNPIPLLTHPVDAINNDRKARGAAFDRLNAHDLFISDPASPEAGESLRNLTEWAIPGLGPAFAGAGRDLNSTDPVKRAQGFGTAVAASSGPAILDGALGAGIRAAKGAGPALIRGAESKYANVLDPKELNPELAQSAAREMIADKVELSDPRADVKEYVAGKMGPAGTRLEQAVQRMPDQLPESGIVESVQAAKAKLFNQDTGAPLYPDSAQIAAKLDQYLQEHIGGNAQSRLAGRQGPGEMQGPASGVIDPVVALKLKRSFDAKPGARGLYDDVAPETPTADVKAQSEIAGALRGGLNANPDVAAANADMSHLAKIRDDIAPGAAKAQPSHQVSRAARAVTGSVISTLGGVVFGHGTGATIGGALALGEVAKYVKSVVSSPEFQTQSALVRDQFGRLIQKQDWNGVLELGQKITQATPRGAGAAPDGSSN